MLPRTNRTDVIVPQMNKGVSQDYVFGEWLFESSIKILKSNINSQSIKPLNKACLCGVPLTMTIPAQGTNSLKHIQVVNLKLKKKLKRGFS